MSIYICMHRYLHEVCSPPVVHRNFKSANILLDDELNPHLSDCGLANLAPSGSERQVYRSSKLQISTTVHNSRAASLVCWPSTDVYVHEWLTISGISDIWLMVAGVSANAGLLWIQCPRVCYVWNLHSEERCLQFWCRHAGAPYWAQAFG